MTLKSRIRELERRTGRLSRPPMTLWLDQDEGHPDVQGRLQSAKEAAAAQGRTLIIGCWLVGKLEYDAKRPGN